MARRRSTLLMLVVSAWLPSACSDTPPSSEDADATLVDVTAENDVALPDPGDVTATVDVQTGVDTAEPPDDTTMADGDTPDAVTEPDESSPSDAAQPSDVSPDAATLPRVGIWSYTPGGIENNTCGEYATADSASPFRMLTSSGGSFEIEQEGGSLNFTCEVLGTSFLCPARLRGESPIENTDVTIAYNVAVEGEVLSSESLRGDQSVTVTCTGSQCAFAPAVLGVTFPCSWQVPFTAEFRVRE